MLLLIAHAPSQNTGELRDALIRGANEQLQGQGELVVKTAFEASAEDVLAASGVMLFTPENFGYMSGALKDFFDRCFYDVLDQTDGLPYALVIRAGKDGGGTKRAVESICAGMNWKRAQETLICQGEFQTSHAAQCEALAAAFSAGISLGIF